MRKTFLLVAAVLALVLLTTQARCAEPVFYFGWRSSLYQPVAPGVYVAPSYYAAPYAVPYGALAPQVTYLTPHAYYSPHYAYAPPLAPQAAPQFDGAALSRQIEQLSRDLNANAELHTRVRKLESRLAEPPAPKSAIELKAP